MDFAADFTAIDFETANRRSDSACQLAAVIVRGGKIVDSAMWMIRPDPFFFSRGNIQIHGITPEQVRSERTFGDLWPEVLEKIGQDCLVAHNAGFDIGVLLACLRRHQHPAPDLHFTCTRAIARRTWPHRRRFGLKPLAEWLGIRFRHHDALEDSIACAKILLAAGIDGEAKDLPELEKKLKLSRGKAGEWGHRGPRRRTGKPRAGKPRVGETRRETRRAADASQPALPFHWPAEVREAKPVPEPQQASLDLQRLLVRAEFIRPLSGRTIVITGRLKKLTQQEAATLATRLGGRCEETVTSETDLIVAGVGKRGRDEAGEQSPDSAKVQVLDEDEFLNLIIAPSIPR